MSAPIRSLEAEVALLGGILLRNEMLDDAAEQLQPADLFRQAHQLIFRAMLALAERRQPIDLVTLGERLREARELDEAGGPAYLATLVDGVPRSTNVAHYAAIVKACAIRREIVREARQLIGAAQDGDLALADLLAQAEGLLARLGQHDAGDGLVPAGPLVHEAVAHLERIATHEGSPTAIATGFRDVDALLGGGLEPGQLIVVGGRPSMGKTAWCTDVVRHVATRVRRPVAFFSQEMSRRDVTVRMLQAQGQLDGQRLRHGLLAPSDYARLTTAIGALEAAPWWVDDAYGVTPAQVRRRCKRLQARHGLALIVIDYLQIMTLGRAAENRNVEVTGMCAGVKAIAKELGVPVILLAQLSREVTRRSDPRPQLSDLRESGAIEQIADVTAFLHRPAYYEKDPAPEQADRAELIVAKQRNGPTGVLELRWHAAETRFATWS